MQDTPIPAQIRNKYSAQFDALIQKSGKPPKSTDELLKYAIAKEKFIKEAAIQEMKRNPVLKDILSKGSLMPPTSVPESPTAPRPAGDSFVPATPLPTQAPLEKLLQQARQGSTQGLPQGALPWQQSPGLFTDPITGRPSIAGALLKDRFQSTALPKQSPAAAPVATAAVPSVAAPSAKLPSGGVSASAPRGGVLSGMGSSVDNGSIAAYIKRMEALAKESTSVQQQAGNKQIEAIKAAYDAQNNAMGGQESALDFYRKQMAGIQRPERDKMSLSAEDKNNMLLRFGLNMLKNNRAGFGQAFGAAGEEALSFGDRATERKYNDAMETYRDAMLKLNTEVNLSEKDKESLRKTAESKLAQAEKIANAQFNVDAAPVDEKKAIGAATTEGMKQAVELAKNAATNNAHLQASRISAAARDAKAKDEGMTASQFSTEAAKRIKYVESLRERLMDLDRKSPNYNAQAMALQSAIGKAQKDADLYMKLSDRAAK